MVDLFLVLVDRDAEPKRPSQASERAQEHRDRLFVCLAIEEVEVWMLALHRDSLGTAWTEIRAERDPKERFAQPFLAARAPKLSPGGGRVWAMRELGAKWRGMLQVCPELAELEQTVQGWLSRRNRPVVDVWQLQPGDRIVRAARCARNQAESVQIADAEPRRATPPGRRGPRSVQRRAAQAAAGCQRSGISSSILLCGWELIRTSTSVRYSSGFFPFATQVATSE